VYLIAGLVQGRIHFAFTPKTIFQLNLQILVAEIPVQTHHDRLLRPVSELIYGKGKVVPVLN
jgi:hypothetical protein